MAMGWPSESEKTKQGFRKSSIAIYQTEPFSEGACRYAYNAYYTDSHSSRYHGEKAIVKKLKNFTYWKREDWDEETKLATKAKELVDKWNATRFPFIHKFFRNATRTVTKQYIIHVPEVIRNIGTGGDFKYGEWVTLEPFIEGHYEKWNSNSGWSKEEYLSVHAFCHWTYHYSGGLLLLCDAQGVRNGDSYCLTDPAICSMHKGQYGMTDCGEAAIAQWFREHRCNTFCKPGWKRHHSSTPSLPIVAASTYKWQTKK